jgi:hypothetical protein
MLEVQHDVPSGADEKYLKELGDFSLMSGGPLYQLWRHTGLAGDALRWTHRRVLVAVLITWVPLLLLSMVDGRAWGDSVVLTFLKDVEAHVRLLTAMPLLMLAEVKVHRELPSILRCFVDRGLISDGARPRFDAAVASAVRLRNSVVAELLLIVLVYVVGMLVIRRTQFALEMDT